MQKSPNLSVEALRARILKRLALREHATQEIYALLQTLGASSETSTLLIDEMVSLQLLSNARYADTYVRSYQHKKGRYFIERKLQHMGISEEDIQQALQQYPPESELATAKNLLQKQKRLSTSSPLSSQQGAQQQRFLLNRGFSWEMIEKAKDDAQKDQQ